MKFELTYKKFGRQAILIEWPNRIDREILYDIIQYKKHLQNIYRTVDLEFVSAYNSLTIITRKKQFDQEKQIKEFQAAYEEQPKGTKQKITLWKIPVCYETGHGMDMERLCERKQLSRSDIIRLHTKNNYTVYGIGFLPGFMYLGGLVEALHTPRLETPRLKVPKGAVAIGGSQTGIYPQESPGGWNIIGRTPIPLFNTSKNPPCFVQVGDSIKFYSVSKPEYDLLTVQLATGVFSLQKEEIKW
ncbi:5-oxoprolinase subunit PxpB [Leptobacterium sp. I13]|uniref:5-oxoprolinase subunit PxpB n=1 Tax=Leptobacterium meishanense TaxID=3128904 RepID=UPI0030EC57F9